MKYKRCSLFMLRSDEDKFYYRLDSPLTSHKSSFEGYFSKLNDQKDILNLGIASKGNNDQSSYDDIINNNLSIKQSQFVFINTEDKNLNNSFRLADLISEAKCMAGSCFGLSYSHKYVWKFGIINYSDSDIDLNIASYKKDLTDTLDNLIKETNGKADGDASIEPKIDYEIKQILPLIKDSNFNEDFLNGNGLKIKCKYNYDVLMKYRYCPLIEEDNIENHGIFTSGNNFIPLEFWLDLGVNIDNIVGISFYPGVDNSTHFTTCCSVKDYEIYISKDNQEYQLLVNNTYDISKGKDEEYIFLFKQENITFDPITFRYLKIKILNFYCTVIGNYKGDIGFTKLRIYTNTKNLYIKEIDNSISNYKDNSFNQVTNKSEWDQKSKEDKIELIKEASFDNPEITKIKNELNDFKIISNHNNIPIYEK